MEFAKRTHTDRLVEVDVTGYSCGTAVEPVGVIRGEYFEGGRFDNVNPGSPSPYKSSRGFPLANPPRR